MLINTLKRVIYCKEMNTASETSGFSDTCTREETTMKEVSKILGIILNDQVDESGFKTKLNFLETKMQNSVFF